YFPLTSPSHNECGSHLGFSHAVPSQSSCSLYALNGRFVPGGVRDNPPGPRGGVTGPLAGGDQAREIGRFSRQGLTAGRIPTRPPDRIASGVGAGTCPEGWWSGLLCPLTAAEGFP
ncbi:Hypothetical predicted protein, partial [Pelobates cultripes]